MPSICPRYILTRKWRGWSYLRYTRHALKIFNYSWCLCVCCQPFLAQKSRDAHVDCLVDIMNDTLGFVHETESLKKIESHKRIILNIIQQTTECGYFIRDYSKTKNFGKFFCIHKIRLVMIYSPGQRAIKHLVSNVDSKVEQFCSKFSELRSALQERAIVHTEISVFRVLETVENISMYFLRPIRSLFERYTSCMQVQNSHSVRCPTQKVPGTIPRKDASQGPG
jgi:hypothetical protein